jgi:hypothetical protein
MPTFPSFRNLVKLSLVALSACSLLASSPAYARDQKETERVDRVIPFSPGGTVKLNNFSGEVRITGSATPQVTVNAIRRATRDRLDAIKLDIRVEGSSIVIDANRRDPAWSERNENVVETTMEIQVPMMTNLVVSVFSSPVTITGVEGRHEVNGFSSKVRLNDVAGPIKAKTFSGLLAVAMSPAAGDANLDLTTFSGDIEVQMPGVPGGRVDFSTFSGDLWTDHPLTLQHKDRRGLRALLNGSGDNELRFHTFSGKVRLTR